jgi:hypothetical protein
MPRHSTCHPTDRSGLEYIINHVFLPLKLPQGSDDSLTNDLVLAQAVIEAALAFSEKLPSDKHLLWMSSLKMLQNLKDSIRFSAMSTKDVESQISAMDNTGALSSSRCMLYVFSINFQMSLYI